MFRAINLVLSVVVLDERVEVTSYALADFVEAEKQVQHKETENEARDLEMRRKICNQMTR